MLNSAQDEDPRTERGPVCGITRITGHVEWICINEPHDTERQRSLQPSALGYYPRSERHYFVRRYPYRDAP